jgi:hypothetical protein
MSSSFILQISKQRLYVCFDKYPPLVSPKFHYKIMSNQVEVTPVTEEAKFKGGVYHVNVERTV